MDDALERKAFTPSFHRCVRCGRQPRVHISRARLGWTMSVRCHGERDQRFVAYSEVEDSAQLDWFEAPEPVEALNLSPIEALVFDVIGALHRLQHERVIEHHRGMLLPQLAEREHHRLRVGDRQFRDEVMRDFKGVRVVPG